MTSDLEYVVQTVMKVFLSQVANQIKPLGLAEDKVNTLLEWVEDTYKLSDVYREVLSNEFSGKELKEVRNYLGVYQSRMESSGVEAGAKLQKILEGAESSFENKIKELLEENN
jgi:hypothetical protein